jgi:hypothetical protein
MQFNHSHGFENDVAGFYYGGRVEYSTNGGTTYLDGGSLITAGQGYGGTLSSCCGNPIGCSPAFVGDSWGFSATQLDLSSLAGQNFVYAFAVYTDTSVDEYGWWVDDIRIYTCATCVANRVLDASYNGLAAFYGATGSVKAGTGYIVAGMESVTFQAPVVQLENDFSVYGDLTINGGGCP